MSLLSALASTTTPSSPPSPTGTSAFPPSTAPSAASIRDPPAPIVASARAAVVASISNIIDPVLAERAQQFHTARESLTAQTADVRSATKGLRKQTDALVRVVGDTEKRRKEMGSLRNWAEVLERDMLTLERTVMIVNGEETESSDGEEAHCLEEHNVETAKSLANHHHPHDDNDDYCPDCDLPESSGSDSGPSTSAPISYTPDPLIINSLPISSLPLALRTGPPLSPLRPRPLSIATSSTIIMSFSRAATAPISPASTSSVRTSTLRFLGPWSTIVGGSRTVLTLHGETSVAAVMGCAAASFAGGETEARSSLIAWRAASTGQS